MLRVSGYETTNVRTDLQKDLIVVNCFKQFWTMYRGREFYAPQQLGSNKDGKQSCLLYGGVKSSGIYRFVQSDCKIILATLIIGCLIYQD